MTLHDTTSSRRSPREPIRVETLARMGGVPSRKPDHETPLEGDKARQPIAHSLSPIEQSRARIARMYALAPEHAPSTGLIRSALSGALSATCIQALTLDVDDRTAALVALNEALPRSTPPARQSVEAMIASGKLADHDVHDMFFNIDRTGHAHPLAYVRSLLFAHAAFRAEIAETPTILEDAKLVGIEGAFRAMLAAALGAEGPGTASSFEMGETPLFPDHAPRRWIRGHQVFAVMTQGLIFAMEALNAATQDRDRTARAAAADLLVVVMNACAFTLELTGDFPPDVYENLIRPAMSLPHQPQGFSGLLSADHSHLVRRMKASRPTMERLRDEDHLRHAAIVTALGRVYDSHKFVCGRFVGMEKSSLLMRSDATRSSVEQLERFKATRIRQIV